MQQSFDAIVIGSGPGGYPAAIKLAQSGKKTALIEASEIGGTCLNRGCIPTKALLANAEILQKIKNAKEYGILVDNIHIDFPAMMKRKDDVILKLRKSLQSLISSHGVTIIQGFASFISANEVKVKGKDAGIYYAKDFIIASGSEPKDIAAFAFDDKQIHSSTSILELKKLPKSMAVVGGGVIGSEFASLYNALGVKVTIIEALPRILPFECETVSHFMKEHFKKEGIEIYTNSFVSSIEKSSEGVTVALKDGKAIDAEIALVSIGRSLNAEGFGLDLAGVITSKGAISVNDKMRTNVAGIYAIGDVTGKTMYAHTATHQGLVAVNAILGKHAFMNYDAVPGVIFTNPEIGSCGLSLDAAIQRGYKAKRATYPLQALGKAQAALQTEGFAQIVFDESTGQILGAQVVCHEASLLIASMALAISNELTLDCILETIHAHPTLAEVWMECAFIATKRPLHYPPLS